MDCKLVHKKLIDYINDNLLIEEMRVIKKHIENCDSCNLDFHQIKTTIADLNAIPNRLPSVEFKDKLRARIQEEIENDKKGQSYKLKSLRRYAAGFLLLLCGGLLGYLFTSNYNMNKEISILKSEINNIKLQESLTAIEEQTASQKIQAISTLTISNALNNEIYSALVNCLVSDENPNVRFAAAKALASYKDIDNVKLLLIESLEYQTDPIVQIFLINTLSNFKNKEAFRAIQSLMNSDNVNIEIKEYSKSVLQNSTIKL